MPSKIPPFTIRLNETTKQKLQYIADAEQRSINKEILYLIEEEIRRYVFETGSSLSHAGLELLISLISSPGC